MFPTEIRLRVAPYARLARRMIAGPGSPESVASEVELLCSEETQPIAQPIYIASHLDRIVSGTEHNSAKFEIDNMLNEVAKHAPTKAYHIKDAVIHKGSVYAGNMRWFLFDPPKKSGIQAFRHFENAALVSSAVGCRYFGHWLRDDCVQHLLGASSWPTVAMGKALTVHQSGYASLFNQDWTLTDSAIIDHLVIYQDYADNSSKRARAKQLSLRITKPGAPGRRHKRVFLRRGNTGEARTVHNENALLEQLTHHGFDILDVTSDLPSIIEGLRDAKLVVSIEGSHIAHCVYCLAEGCALLVLQPCDRFTAVHRLWTSSRGLKFGFLVGPRHFGGYEFDAEQIVELSDKLLEQA